MSTPDINPETRPDGSAHDSAAAPQGEHCPVCGKELVTGTVDFAGTPEETTDLDVGRSELRPGQMVQVSMCPDPSCPGPDSGAQV